MNPTQELVSLLENIISQARDGRLSNEEIEKWLDVLRTSPTETFIKKALVLSWALLGDEMLRGGEIETQAHSAHE